MSSERQAVTELKPADEMTVANTATNDEIAGLLARASTGDQMAWAVLIERFEPMLRAVVAGFRLDSHTAADVVQIVWLRLHEHSGRIRQPERLGAWLATTARNEALRSIKKSRRTSPAGELADEVDVTAPSPDERVVDRETLRDVMAAVETLPEESQRLLELLMVTPPLPYTDIAARLGRPVGSIGPTRGRCLETLRARLAGCGPVPVAA